MSIIECLLVFAMLQQFFRGWRKDAWVISVLNIISFLLMILSYFQQLLRSILSDCKLSLQACKSITLSWNLSNANCFAEGFLTSAMWCQERASIHIRTRSMLSKTGPFQILSVRLDAFLSMRVTIPGSLRVCINSETLNDLLVSDKTKRQREEIPCIRPWTSRKGQNNISV